MRVLSIVALVFFVIVPAAMPAAGFGMIGIVGRG